MQLGQHGFNDRKESRQTYLSTMSACPWFNVDLMHESNTRRCSSISRFDLENFAMSFASSASARAALCAFHLSRMVMITAQYFVSEERMASAESLDFRGAHTASTTSYSAASPASVGRTFGKGDGSWGDSGSDPESYLEPSSDSVSLELSEGDTDLEVAGFRDPEIPDLAIADLVALILSFFNTGPRAELHGPAPFSMTAVSCTRSVRSAGFLVPARSRFFTSALDRRLLTRAWVTKKSINCVRFIICTVNINILFPVSTSTLLLLMKA